MLTEASCLSVRGFRHPLGIDLIDRVHGTWSPTVPTTPGAG